mgnify:CR=1 FL=1
MNIDDFFAVLQKKLAENETIEDFCQDKFGRKQTVFLGTNENDPPAQSDMPSIAISGLLERARKGTSISFKIVFGIIVLSENIDVQDNKKTYLGFSLCNRLEEIFEDALYETQRALQSKIEIEEASHVPNMVFPVFLSRVIVKFEYPIPSFRKI